MQAEAIKYDSLVFPWIGRSAVLNKGIKVRFSGFEKNAFLNVVLYRFKSLNQLLNETNFNF